MTPKRIQRKRTKGWKMPPNSLYVGRGSRWGNPFRVLKHPSGKWGVKTDGGETCGAILTAICRLEYDTKQDAARDAVRCYRKYMLPYELKNGGLRDFCLSLHNWEEIQCLSGKNLACWCGENDYCHADLLLLWANPILNLKTARPAHGHKKP